MNIELKSSFENLLLGTNIEGMKELLMWLDLTDFYTAPASTKYHGSFEGGLLLHSLNVYGSLRRIMSLHDDRISDYMYTESDLIVSALLHDICKADCYEIDYKNYKERNFDSSEVDKRDIKKDSISEFVWKEKSFYVFNDKFPFGHGEKSVFLANQFITLSEHQAMAIRYHMGAFMPEDVKNISAVFTNYPLALYLHMADMYSTYRLEV